MERQTNVIVGWNWDQYIAHMVKHNKTLQLKSPIEATVLWRVISADLDDVAKFAREAIAQSGRNHVAQEACFHACVIAYGRCFVPSKGGRPLLTAKDVKRVASSFKEVNKELYQWRNKFVAHDEFPDSHTKATAVNLNGKPFVGWMSAKMLAPTDGQLAEIARFAECLNDRLVKPEIERLTALSMDQLIASIGPRGLPSK